MSQSHRTLRIRFPDAPVGTCRHCNTKCVSFAREHPDCAQKFNRERDYRGALKEDGVPEVCIDYGRGKGICEGPLEADHVYRLADNGPRDWTVYRCKKHHQIKTQKENKETRNGATKVTKRVVPGPPLDIEDIMSRRGPMSGRGRPMRKRYSSFGGSRFGGMHGGFGGFGGGISGSGLSSGEGLTLTIIFGLVVMATGIPQKVLAWIREHAPEATPVPAPEKPVSPIEPVDTSGLVSAVVPILLTLLVLVLGYLVIRFFIRRRKARTQALLVGLARVTRTDPEYIKMRVRWNHKRPVSGRASYDGTFDDAEGSRARAEVEEYLRRKAEIPIDIQWSPARNTVKWNRAKETTPTPEVKTEDPPTFQMDVIYNRLLSSLESVMRGEIQLTIDAFDNTGPSALTIRYPATFRDDSDELRLAVQKVVNAKASGRWRSEWITEKNTVVFERRPHMPKIASHPVPDEQNTEMLSVGLNENSEVAFIEFDKAPHTLVAGETGSGKTVFIRGAVMEAADRGADIYICDPKRIEMAGLKDWPGVKEIATGTEQMIALVEKIYRLMDQRYIQIEQGKATSDDFTPVLLVIDEAREWIDRSNAFWKATREKGQTGSEHPAVEMWRSIGRLGRSARIRLLIGIQRPDAKVFGGEARDQYGNRIAFGELSEQGARMMFGHSNVGRDLPTDAKGRATVDLGSGIMEVQTWWTPDPRAEVTPADKAILDALYPHHRVPRPPTHEWVSPSILKTGDPVLWDGTPMTVVGTRSDPHDDQIVVIDWFDADGNRQETAWDVNDLLQRRIAL